MRPPRAPSSKLLQGIVVGILAALSISTFGLGGELDKDSRVFPYSGTLEYNGSGYTGTADFKFTVTGTATNTDGGTTTTTFSEQHENVSVYAGKFQVTIGSKTTTGVPTWVFDQERVYISMDVRDGAGSGTSGFSALTGKQRIYPAPFAYWAAEGNKFTADGYTQLKGSVSAGGSDLYLGLNDGRSQYKSGNAPDAGAKLLQRAMVHTGDDQLFINYDGDFEGGLSLTGPTVHSGTFSQTGATSLTGATTLTGTTTQAGNLTMSSGDLSVSSGLASVSRANANVLSLTSTSGNEANITWQNAAGGKWNTGVGGSVGSNDFFFYSGNDNKVAMEIEQDGDVNVAQNLTVAGTITHKTACPGSPSYDVNKDSQKSRLCVYYNSTGRTWREAVRHCWDNVYGSQLCTMQQVRIACMSGMGLATNTWLADRAVDDQAFEVNSTNCDNFDGDVDYEDSNGAYCCLYLRVD